MKIKEVKWYDWWVGLRTNIIKCIGVTGTSWAGTNLISTTGIPGTKSLGLNWEQALAMFSAHIALEIFTYLKNNPSPETVESNVDTMEFSKAELAKALTKAGTTTVNNPTEETK